MTRPSNLIGAALALSLAGLAGTAQAASFDVSDAAGLIAAIQTANNNDEPDTIDLGGNTIQLTASNNSTDNANGLPSIVAGGGELTIRNGTICRADSEGCIGPDNVNGGISTTVPFRLVHVAADGALRLERLTLRGGEVAASGGGVFSRGTLTLDRCTVQDNVATNGSAGAGIFLRTGVTTIINSTISHNILAAGATGAGAGIAVNPFGGAPAGQVFLISSTVTGNANRSNLGRGGGLLAVNGGTITLRNSIVSGNTATTTGGEIVDLTGGALIISQGGNLIGHSGVANTEGFTPGPNDLVPAGALDTILNTTLAENGGPAQIETHALVTDSPAIDFVPTANCTVSTDQRGVDRPKGSGCDAGAYEFGTDSVDLGITKTGPVSAKVGDTLTYRLVVVNNGPDDASEVRVNDRMPDSLQAVSATSSQGNCFLDPRPGRGSIAVLCLLGDLPNGATAEIVIEAVALQTGLIENQGQVTWPINVQNDRDPSNDNDSAFTQVDPAGPVYAATVQQPIDADGGSTFNAKKGVIPVKFTLTADGAGTCSLPPATIGISRIGGATPQPVDESVFGGSADSGTSFRITDCQYHYNVNAKSLGAGQYQVDILIGSTVIGTATFALK